MFESPTCNECASPAVWSPAAEPEHAHAKVRFALRNPSPAGRILQAMKQRPLTHASAAVSVVALCATLMPAPARAADDPRGQRGWFVAGGGGGVIGGAVDDAGRDTPSFFGTGGGFRFGEEVIPRLTLGLEFSGAGGSGDAFSAGIGGLFLQSTYRPGWGTEGLVFLLGTGVGGGSLTADDDGGPEGAGGGAIFQAGVSYELDFFGAPDEGVAFAPFVRWHFVPSTPDNEVQFSAFVVGLEVPYYAGR